MRDPIEAVRRQRGFRPPTICTPERLALEERDMTPAPVMDEVREIRDAIAQEHGYDIDAIFEALRRMEETSGRPHVTPPTRHAPGSHDSTSTEDTAQQRIEAGSASRRR